MTPEYLLIVLAMAGFLLLMAEIFVPGMVLGIIGLACLAGSILIGYTQYGALGGSILAAGISFVVLVGFVVWMSMFQKTGIGRRLMLNSSLQQGDSLVEEPDAGLLGKQGVAITPLRPAGTAELEGKKVDVFAESNLIEAGTPILVVEHEGVRVVVRAVAAPEPGK